MEQFPPKDITWLTFKMSGRDLMDIQENDLKVFNLLNKRKGFL
jgi:hypothetical protein